MQIQKIYIGGWFQRTTLHLTEVLGFWCCGGDSRVSRKDALPKFTAVGLLYFLLLLAMTYIINFAVSRLYKNKKYPIKARDLERDIR